MKGDRVLFDRGRFLARSGGLLRRMDMLAIAAYGYDDHPHWSHFLFRIFWQKFMCLISKTNAIDIARAFLETEGHVVVECAQITHATKEMYEIEFEEPRDYGNYLLEIVVVTPPDAKYVVKDPRGDIRAVKVNDQTGKAEYIGVM
ncbi:hypothetical protein [Symmachiella dynata]|uniref:hypothetical protein n=1 Tax=Symmachiella dynata TaxID=2527995 RepID=UPI0030EC80F1